MLRPIISPLKNKHAKFDPGLAGPPIITGTSVFCFADNFFILPSLGLIAFIYVYIYKCLSLQYNKNWYKDSL